MTDMPTLAATLRATSETLKTVRNMVVQSGHLHEMLDIDTLVNVAQVEAERRAVIMEVTSSRRQISPRDDRVP
ncbi:hypothetical protein [Mesorhizobium sp. Root172]|uniref:Uncharacterized protein n=1 Tax=Rhizobium loti TaxID=381 RepID=A0A6M7U6Z9_RHILI|nr:hypothetical protein [Mesorhizobium sp. Root172]KRB22498.1 hypothetical protein ASE05_14915 [Mesorhizobium sp. Root172]OBQ62169.1 hypothetical protein A8145_21140 [Mesorhizobium loti]QKC71237.1 hypothetical protein EB815_20410 [Mesorhizobium loti]QKC90219.1 hypothetical protein EB230_18770 [Mesorhizobium sp. NZP2234]